MGQDKRTFRLSDGSYDAVKRIYESLSAQEKNYVTPGRTIYKDIPSALAARTVAYADDDPAGFVDIYGPYAKSKHKHGAGYFTMETAVKDDYRGNGLSPAMAVDAIKKVVGKIRENRQHALKHGFKLPIPNEPDVFIWNFLRGNKPSENAALRAGFVKRKNQSYMMPMSQAEKLAAEKIDISKLYEEIRKRYSDMGFSVDGDKLVVREQPTYMNGNPVPRSVMKPNESGGNVQSDGTIRINPKYRSVMKHWGLKGSGSDFVRKIIGHEMGHHIDFTILSKPDHAAERKKILDEIARKRFHTVYTDSYGPDTDKRKLDKELLAEYLASKATEKNAQSIVFGGGPPICGKHGDPYEMPKQNPLKSMSQISDMTGQACRIIGELGARKLDLNEKWCGRVADWVTYLLPGMGTARTVGDVSGCVVNDDGLGLLQNSLCNMYVGKKVLPIGLHLGIGGTLALSRGAKALWNRFGRINKAVKPAQLQMPAM